MKILNITNASFFISMLFLFFYFAHIGEAKEMKQLDQKEKIHVLLLGASIGKGWNFKEISIRMNNINYDFEFLEKYEPDKSDLVNEAINRKNNKPDIVIIKQCAAYIPATKSVYDSSVVETYKKLAIKWVNELKREEIIPILATIVPITEDMPLKNRIKIWLKIHIFRKKLEPYYRKIRLKGIIEYNDWVKQYSENQSLAVLDLESVLHISKEKRYLKPELSTDGLHLNRKAYKILDSSLLETLNKLKKN